MTVAIGLACRGMTGNYMVVTADSRASYKYPLKPNDACGKVFTLPLFDCVAAVAGSVSIAQQVVSQLAFEVHKLEGLEVHTDHIRNALIEARFYIQTKHVDRDIRDELNMNLEEWKRGPLDARVYERGKQIILDFKLNAHVIVAGFINREPIFWRMIGDLSPEEESSPAVYVIGTPAASGAAQNTLNKRSQSRACSLARSLVHIHEAIRAARRSIHGDYVGPEAGYRILRDDRVGIGHLQGDCPLLKSWLKTYKKNTQSLDEPGFTGEIEKLIFWTTEKPQQALGLKELD